MTYRRPTRQRLLHLGHFAFMRAVVQGLPADEVWDRYLSVEGQRSDVRVVRSTIRWIRAEFAAAARRQARPGTARLMRLEVERLVDTAPRLPNLTEFAEEAGLEDEPQREQIAAYEARYGAATARAVRKGRLLRRQLDALRWLELLVARRPAGGDSVASWLRPELAARLETAGVFTLAQLAERINGLGKNWARSIKGLGPTKSHRVAQWVAEHGESIGTVIGAHTTRRRGRLAAGELARVVEPATGIRPLEKFLVPAALDGSRGAYRRPQEHCLLQATNDFDAILAWLRAKRGPAPGRAPPAHGRGDDDAGLGWLKNLSHTQRSYRKEAERFLLWAIVQRGKPLSSIAAEDCTAYRDFLADPQPRARWCGPRARERWSPLWRPFEGPLSAAAQRQAITILKSLYGYLVDQNYLMGNPWAALTVPRASRPALNVGRSLTRDQWAFVRGRAAAAGADTMAVRLRLALGLLYATGLRASEIVAARCGDLQRVEYLDPKGAEPTRGWMLTVVGKGDKLREVPVPQAWLDELSSYLQLRGLDPDVAAGANPDAHLLGIATDELAQSALHAGRDLDPKGGIAEGTLYRQLKRFFEGCAAELRAAGDAASAARLALASTHWMRHTHATHALASGVKIEVAQQNLGHASLATTTAYVTTEKSGRIKAMEGFWDAELPTGG